MTTQQRKVTFENAQPGEIIEQELSGEQIRYTIAVCYGDLKPGSIYFTRSPAGHFMMGTIPPAPMEEMKTRVVFQYTFTRPRKKKKKKARRTSQPFSDATSEQGIPT